MNRNAPNVRWLALDHATRSVRRASPDASGEKLAGLIDDALDFEPGPGHSRDQALLVVWRGAFVNTARQTGQTLAEIAERLCAIEGRDKPLSGRQLIECGQRATAFEARIDGSSWVRLDAGTTRGLSSARDAYVQAQQRVLGLSHALLHAAGSVKVVEVFLQQIDPAPSWIDLLGQAESCNEATAHGLRAAWLAAHRKRDRAAQVYRDRIDASMAHLRPEHRPVIDAGSKLRSLAETITRQRRDDERDKAAARRPVSNIVSADPVASLTGHARDGRRHGKERSARSRASRGERDGHLPYLADFNTGPAAARLATLRERIEAEPDPAKRGRLEAQIVGLQQAA